MFSKGYFVFCLAFSIAAAGCQPDTSSVTTGGRPNVDLSTVANLIRVPLVDQGTNYTCGVAALESVLYYYDLAEDHVEEELAVTLQSNRIDGTVSKNMADFAESRGFSVVRTPDMTLAALQSHIDAGKPVIVLLQAWASESPVDWVNEWDEGHFAVAIGYDNSNIYFMDPSTTGNYTYVPTDEFVDRWHDVDGQERVQHFGMLVSKGSAQFNLNEALPMN